MVHEITDESEFNSTLSSNSVVAVQMFASWCGPCKAAAPKFDEVSEQHPEATFVKVDVDELAEVAETWGVNCMPTFIVFKDGQVAQKIEGADFDRLRNAVTMYITTDTTTAFDQTHATNTLPDAGQFDDDEDSDEEDEDDDDDEEYNNNNQNDKRKRRQQQKHTKAKNTVVKSQDDDDDDEYQQRKQTQEFSDNDDDDNNTNKKKKGSSNPSGEDEEEKNE